MYEAEDCLLRYHTLLTLLNQEQEAVSHCLNGELLAAYDALLIQERNELQKMLDHLNQLIHMNGGF